jgi:hypothetical protein
MVEYAAKELIGGLQALRGSIHASRPGLIGSTKAPPKNDPRTAPDREKEARRGIKENSPVVLAMLSQDDPKRGTSWLARGCARRADFP